MIVVQLYIVHYQLILVPYPKSYLRPDIQRLPTLTFDDFEFDYDLLDGLDAMGFRQPTPIQAEAIPPIMDLRDLIGVAQTGTGKTAAFLLPTLHHLTIREKNDTSVNCLILAPTRELVQQIDRQIEALSYFTGVSSATVYGGGDSRSFEQQKKALTKGADIVVATPGRLIAHLQLGYVNFSNVKHFILDEADRMLDMGFQEDLTYIADKLPKERQTLLFSATMPPNIRKLANDILTDPVQVNIAISKPAENVLQAAYSVYDNQKIPLIQDLLEGKSERYSSVLVFSATKRGVNDIARALNRIGIKAERMSSDLEQAQREDVLQRFASKQVQILVATDILSRGIDIKDINLVINYDVPGDAADYVHRIGRTARADATGVAITLIAPRDQRKFKVIEDLIEQDVPKPPLPKELGEGPAYDPANAPHDRRGGRGGGGSRKGRSGGRGGNRNRGGNNRKRSGGGNRRRSKRD